MTLENEKRFLLLLSSYINGNGVSKAEVLNTIENEDFINLDSKDIQIKENRNELVWRNDLAFVRKHLEQNNYFISGIRNDWSITISGKKELKKLCTEIFTKQNFKKITNTAIIEAKKIYSIL